MILRTYRVRVDPKKVALHEAFERNEGVPMVRGMKGCLGCGFGRIREAAEPTYLFVSIWESQEALDRARSEPTWKRVAGKLETLGLSLGGDVLEHIELGAFELSNRPPKP